MVATSRAVEAELLPEELEELRRRAARRGMSPNDYLRRALADERFLEDEVSDGGTVLIKKSNGALQKVGIAQPS
jgi:hypothetical protein